MDPIEQEMIAVDAEKVEVVEQPPVKQTVEKSKPKKKRSYTKHKEKELVMIEKKERRNRILMTVGFLTPPILVSLVSVFHTFTWFQIGNAPLQSGMLSGSYEVIVLSLIMLAGALAILGRGVKLWNAFLVFLIAFILAFSNSYSVWIRLSDASVSSVAQMVGLPSGIWAKRLIAFFQGIPITMISLSFIPIYIKYLEKLKSKKF